MTRAKILILAILTLGISGFADSTTAVPKPIKFKSLELNGKKLTKEILGLIKSKGFVLHGEFMGAGASQKVNGKVIPHIQFDDSTFVIHVFKIWKDDPGDGYLILLRSSPKLMALDTLGPFFNLDLKGLAYVDLDNDGKTEVIVNYEYELNNGQTVYKKGDGKYMPFFQFSKGPRFPEVRDINGDGVYEIISFIELEDTSKGNMLLGSINQYWNDVYAFKDGQLVKSNKDFKNYLEKNISKYKQAIQDISGSELIKERLSFMDEDPTKNYIQDLNFWIKTIEEL